MGKTAQRRRKNSVTPEEHEGAALISFLPKPPHVVPYVKSFRGEESEIIIRGSKLMYTACSSKQWRAPVGVKGDLG